MVGASSSASTPDGTVPPSGASSADGAATASGQPTSPRSITPTTVKDLRDAVTTNGAVLIRGTGTATTWGAPVRDARTTVSLAGMDRVLDYRPADMTVHVQGGIRLDALQFTRLAGGRPMCPARAQDIELGGDKDLAAHIVERLNFVI